jgi:hypothetical protein
VLPDPDDAGIRVSEINVLDDKTGCMQSRDLLNCGAVADLLAGSNILGPGRVKSNTPRRYPTITVGAKTFTARLEHGTGTARVPPSSTLAEKWPRACERTGFRQTPMQKRRIIKKLIDSRG